MSFNWLTPELEPYFEFARKTTAQWSKSFYAAARFLPKEQRWATYALYGYCRYLDNLVDLPRNRSPREIIHELNAFNKELETAYRTGQSQHPVLRPFIAVVRHYGIPLELPKDLIKGVRMDLRYKRYDSFEQLYTFAYRVASVVGLMMSFVIKFSHSIALHHAEALGIAMQLTNILRDVDEDYQNHRIYLPMDEMRAFGVHEEDLQLRRMNENLRKFIAFQVERAERYYEKAHPGIQLLSPHSRFSIYAASRIYRGILDQIKSNEYNPFLGRVFVSSAKKKRILLAEVARQILFPETEVSGMKLQAMNDAANDSKLFLNDHHSLEKRWDNYSLS